MRRRRRRSLWPVILIVLLLVLLALVAVFVSRVGGINVGELFRNTGNVLKPNKAEQLVMATPSPVVWSPTPMPTAVNIRSLSFGEKTSRMKTGGRNFSDSSTTGDRKIDTS